MTVDLRSDTVTRPTPAMREAMATGRASATTSTARIATVNALERRAAELCGREAALFVPSGTMANQIGVGLWAGQGDEVYAHRDAHLLIDEAGGVAALWGAQTRGLHSPGYALDVERAAATRCRWTRATSTARARACSASRTRTSARAGACGAPRRSRA